MYRSIRPARVPRRSRASGPAPARAPAAGGGRRPRRPPDELRRRALRGPPSRRPRRDAQALARAAAAGLEVTPAACALVGVEREELGAGLSELRAASVWPTATGFGVAPSTWAAPRSPVSTSAASSSARAAAARSASAGRRSRACCPCRAGPARSGRAGARACRRSRRGARSHTQPPRGSLPCRSRGPSGWG